MGIVGRASVRLLTGVRFFEQTVRSAKWALADQVIVSGFNFLTSLLLARILGIEEFGRYALAWTVVLFVQGIQYSTISSTMLSIGPKHDPPAARAYFGAIFVHQAIFGFLSTVLTWLGVNLAAPLFSRFNARQRRAAARTYGIELSNPRFPSPLFLFRRTSKDQLGDRYNSLPRTKCCNTRNDQVASC